MSLQTKIIIAQTIALAIVAPVAAFAMHGIELACRAVWKRITASRIVGDIDEESTGTVQEPSSIPQYARGRRETKKSRRRRNRMLKADLKRANPQSKP
jgi:hypothetical protein